MTACMARSKRGECTNRQPSGGLGFLATFAEPGREIELSLPHPVHIHQHSRGSPRPQHATKVPAIPSRTASGQGWCVSGP
jgi:hypothetical protein